MQRFARGGTWNEDGVIVFGDRGPGLQRIPASGGTPSPVTRVNKEAGETFHYYPQFLPGGKQFLYLVRHGEAEKMGIYIGSLDGKPGTPATRIVQTQFKADYDAGSGRLLYLQGAGVLMAQRLELDPPRLTGDPATVAEGVRIAFSNGYAEFSVSRNGTLFYGQGSGGEKVRFGWRDRAGKLLETIGQPVEARFAFSLSPDGSRVAYTAGPGLGQPDIWVLELAGGLSTTSYLQPSRLAAMVAGREAALLHQPKRNPPESGGWVWRGGVVDEGEPNAISCKACRPTASFCCMELMTL